MISSKDFALIAALDLNPIKTRLMHVESGEGWSLERANVIETEYRRFLYLLKAFPNVQIAPLADVDTFWHYHILDTMKYARDCEQAFGRFMHHCPTLDMGGEDGARMQQQAGEHMRELYESTFGVPDESGASQAADPAWCVGPDSKAAKARSAWCVGPDVKASGARSAWCVGPDIGKAGDAQTAWCVGPSVVKSA